MPKYADNSGLVYDIANPDLNPDLIKGKTLVPDTTPTGSSIYKPTTLPSGLSGYTDPMGNFSMTLNTASLTPQPSPTLPPASQYNNNFSGLLSLLSSVSGGQAIIDAFNKSLTTPPPSTADLYNTAYPQSGIEQKSQDVLNAQTATKQAQAKLAGINAQLAGINAEAQAIPIRLQQQSEGRGITTGGLAPIQTGLLRENALKALPLQAQALGAQAEIATAQGNQELAQKSLEMAQSKLDTIFKIRLQDEENTYNYQKDLRDKVFTLATEAEKVKLQNAQKIADQQFQLYKDRLNDIQTVKNSLMQNGEGDLASKVSQLDPNSPTFTKDIGELQKQSSGGSMVRAIADPITGEIHYYTSKGKGSQTNQSSSNFTPTFPTQGIDAVHPLVKPAIENVLGQSYIDMGKLRDSEFALAQKSSLVSGIPLLSKGDADKVQESNQTYQSASALIKQIVGLSKNVITAKNNLGEMAAQGAKLKVIETAPWISTNNDIKQFISARASLLSLITRAAGEKGTLTNQDVERIASALPSYSDNAELAKQKAANLDNVVKSVFSGSISAYIGSATAGIQNNQVNQNNDPLGIR